MELESTACSFSQKHGVKWWARIETLQGSLRGECERLKPMGGDKR